ncbi:diacylglycerol/polyprenol kinase family protein [Nanoarchaeota archaeon]
MEYFRIEKGITFYKSLTRKNEEKKLAGTAYCFLAAIVVFAVFDFNIAITSLMFMWLGDGLANIYGTYVGKIRLKNGKSFEGTVTGFIVNVLVANIILGFNWHLILPMAFTASVVELFSTSRLNDNLTVPLASGFVGQVIVITLGCVGCL